MNAIFYLYLGLLIVTALLFYLHGFRAGAEQAKDNFERYFRRHTSMTFPSEPELPIHSIERESLLDSRRDVSSRNTPPLRGDFSNN